AHAGLRKILAENADATRKLRAMWALFSSGGLPEKDLLPLLDAENEHVRAWAVRLIVDGKAASAAAAEKFAAMAAKDASPLVRLYLASALQRLEPAARWPIVQALSQRSEDAEDPNIPYMLWYGTEPLVTADLAKSATLAADCKIPFVRTSVARRMASGK